MSKQKFVHKLGATAMAASMIAASSVTAFAASSANTNNNTATNNDLADFDIRDDSLKGSISIYKYDIVSAQKDNVYTAGTREASGTKDTELENLLADYAIQGVEFTYLKCGQVETYSVNDGTNTFIQLAYEVPDALAEILGLDEDDAMIMQDHTDTTSGKTYTVAFPCANTGVKHFTSQQINDTLASILATDNIAAKNALEKYARNASGSVVMTPTTANGFTKAENLDLGLYLIVETKVPEMVTSTTNPWFVMFPFTYNAGNVHGDDGKTKQIAGNNWEYDITCYPKNQTGEPVLKGKQVRNATGVASTTKGTKENTSYIVSNLLGDEGGAGGFAKNRGDALNGATTETGEYKFADSTTASEGDVLDYAIVTRLPHIESKATALSKFTFNDTLSKGLEYNQDVAIAIYANEQDALENNTANATEIWTEQNGYLDTYTNINIAGDDHGTRMKIIMTKDGLARINGTVVDGEDTVAVRHTDNITEGTGEIDDTTGLSTGAHSYARLSDYYMVVYYTATVNSDESVTLGDDGNMNDLKLTYARTSGVKLDSEGDPTTLDPETPYENELEDRAYVFSYGIDLTKRFSDDNGDATKVQFKLYNETDGYYVTAQRAAGSDTYYVTGKNVNKENGTTFSPTAEGKLIIEGLEADKYQLTEVATDKGYSLLKDQIEIDITSSIKKVDASIAGAIGLDAASASIEPADGQTSPHVHTGACYDVRGFLICGHQALETADGRTIGKIAMKDYQYENDIAGSTRASAKVDGKDATMLIDKHDVQYVETNGNDNIIKNIESQNAIVKLEVMNSKGFLLPQTGGNGLYAVTIFGVVAVAAGCFVSVRRAKRA